MSPPSTPPESFATLVKAMESILERLLSVSRRQLKFVQDDDEVSLDRLLGHKLKLLDERERISRCLDPHRGIPEEQRRWNSETERQETEAARDRCQQLLAETLRLDEQSIQLKSKQIEDVKEQLRRINQGSRLHAAYSKQKRMDN